jgi:hypothetical protein
LGAGSSLSFNSSLLPKLRVLEERRAEKRPSFPPSNCGELLNPGKLDSDDLPEAPDDKGRVLMSIAAGGGVLGNLEVPGRGGVELSRAAENWFLDAAELFKDG